MVLGEITTESTQYGKQETTVKPIEGADLAQQLKAAVENIHAEITEPEITDDELDQNAEPLPADPNVKNFSYTNVDGQVYYRENSYMNKVDLPAVTAERVLGMIALRETTQKLLDCQLHDGTDAEVELLQGKLKDQYKRFTAQYGLINSTANKRAFRQDSSYCLLASLEILDEDKNLKRLADIFTKRTIRKPEPVTSVDTPSEALALSIGEKAKVDVPFMAELCRKDRAGSDRRTGRCYLPKSCHTGVGDGGRISVRQRPGKAGNGRNLCCKPPGVSGQCRVSQAGTAERFECFGD